MSIGHQSRCKALAKSGTYEVASAIERAKKAVLAFISPHVRGGEPPTLPKQVEGALKPIGDTRPDQHHAAGTCSKEALQSPTPFDVNAMKRWAALCGSALQIDGLSC
jgi:hypothetical protein